MWQGDSVPRTLSQDICDGLTRPTNTNPTSRLQPSLGTWGEMEGRWEDSWVDSSCSLECPLIFLELSLLNKVLMGWDTPWSLWPSCPMGRRGQLGTCLFYFYFFLRPHISSGLGAQTARISITFLMPQLPIPLPIASYTPYIGITIVQSRWLQEDAQFWVLGLPWTWLFCFSTPRSLFCRRKTEEGVWQAWLLSASADEALRASEGTRVACWDVFLLSALLEGCYILNCLSEFFMQLTFIFWWDKSSLYENHPKYYFNSIVQNYLIPRATLL